MDFDVIDMILGNRLKGVARKVAYVLVWLALMIVAILVVLTMAFPVVQQLEALIP